MPGIILGKNKFVLGTHLGSGSGEVKGKKVEFDLGLTIQNHPYVFYKGKHFVLTWDDVVKLAEGAGLFEEEGETEDAKNV